MPPKDEQRSPIIGTLYMVDKETGATTELGPFRANANDGIVFPNAPDTPAMTPRIRTNEEFTFTLPMELHPRKASRKKFMKKAMAMGFSRNQAEVLSLVARASRYSYATALFYLRITGTVPLRISTSMEVRSHD